MPSIDLPSLSAVLKALPAIIALALPVFNLGAVIWLALRTNQTNRLIEEGKAKNQNELQRNNQINAMQLDALVVVYSLLVRFEWDLKPIRMAETVSRPLFDTASRSFTAFYRKHRQVGILLPEDLNESLEDISEQISDGLFNVRLGADVIPNFYNEEMVQEARRIFLEVVPPLLEKLRNEFRVALSSNNDWDLANGPERGKASELMTVDIRDHAF